MVTNRENGKRYVGQHNKENPKIRWAEHKRATGKYLFHSALRKYGVDNFTWEVLIVCAQERLTLMEGYYAEQFQTYVWDSPGGYNAVWCSESFTLGLKASQETKEKLRQAHLGKKHSPDACEKIRQASLGKKHSPETIENMRQANIGRKRSPEAIENMRQGWVTRKMKYSTILE